MADPRPPTRFAWNTTDLSVFDPVIAHAACWAAYYAYYDAADEWFIKIMGADSLLRFPADPASGRPGGYFISLPEGALVVFAGTTDANQLYGILRDSVFGRVPNQPGGVQAMYGVTGWVQSLVTLYGTLLATAMNNKKVIFAGHSIGGALAVTLLAAMKGYPGLTPQPFTFYTFGAPRTGNSAFNSVATGGFNVINVGDPVCKLPPFGYLRPGNPLATPPSYTVCPPNRFVGGGTLVYLRSGSEAVLVQPGTIINPNDSPIEWDATRFTVELFGTTFPGEQPRKVVQAWNDSIEAHESAEYLRRLEGLLPVVSGQHATMGDDGKKAEAELPPAPFNPNDFLSTWDVQTPPPPTGPSGPASQGVVPLTGRRRH